MDIDGSNYDSFKPLIRIIKDHPVKGVNFKDITLLLSSPGAFSLLIDKMCYEVDAMPLDFIVGIESRGFIFGAAMAAKLGIGFVPIRKKGKLPAEVIAETYETEYSTDTLEIHLDALRLKQHANVLIVDDVLATGGTALASAKLVKGVGGNVMGIMFLMDIPSLKGKEALSDYQTLILMGD